MNNKLPLIAIIGRPNVGKSTFFNRMLKARKAIVDAREGITRDRIYGKMDWEGHEINIVDTGGFIPDDVDIFNAAIRSQIKLAVLEADLILFIVDGREYSTASDIELAQIVHDSGKKCVLVVNKCDHSGFDENIYQWYELGIETIIPISALTGRSTGDLLEIVIEKLDISHSVSAKDDDDNMRITIVGMPNVGKSSLTNALLQKEQIIVTPIAGTTRDSIDSHLVWYGKNITIVDTAGMRKQAKVTDSIEYYSSVRARQATATSHVVVVLIDAEKGFCRQDKTIIDHVIKMGKGLLLIVNKWDLIKKDSSTMSEYKREIAGGFKTLSHYPLMFISALTRQRVSSVLKVSWEVYNARKKRIGTKELNEWLVKTTAAHPVSAVQGKSIKLKFITQVHSEPPVFAVFCNYPKLISTAYRRYLENELYERFNFSGVPVKLSFRNS
ncbi:MAG: ribosome biogenesis GTPase Der [Candidatus Neomarinimicrobiota bacterium]